VVTFCFLGVINVSNEIDLKTLKNLQNIGCITNANLAQQVAS